MFSTSKTNTCWYKSTLSRTLLNSLLEPSLPFLSVFVNGMTLLRFDRGILRAICDVLWIEGWGLVVRMRGGRNIFSSKVSVDKAGIDAR
jgi:hypothetical protein